MDSLTHIVLGACIGEAIAGKKIGKKAMLIGAIAQSIPDVDFITTFWLSDSKDILEHRGITHSILFALVATLLLSWILRYLFRKQNISWSTWFALLEINIFTHLFIDGFNAYGIGLLEPFSHWRFSFHILFVADPFFSIWPFIACLVLLILRRQNLTRKNWWRMGIGVSTIYLMYAIVNKVIVEKAVSDNLVQQGISTENYFTTPTPFNSWLWFVVAKDKGGYYVSYRSVFDRKKKKMTFQYFPQNDSLLTTVKNRVEVNDLVSFANGFYTVENRSDTTIINILRFGQVVGWYDPKEKFSFYYYLDKPGSNKLVTQRGRFERWNEETIRAFLNRIEGN